MRAVFARALALALLCAPAAPQEGLPPRGELPRSDAQQEILELFAKVERALKEIDAFLVDAAAGEVPLAQPGESGLADLLRTAQERSRGAVSDIDRLMEVARQQSSQSSGGSGGQPPPSGGDSPLDRSRSDRPQEPEATPENPDQGAQGQPAGQRPEDGGDPQDDDTQNEANRPPDGAEAGAPSRRDDGGERWGELPPRVREVFRSQGGGDLPVQYRDWIDSYYRRLNRRP